MPQTIATYSQAFLVPAIEADEVVELSVNLTVGTYLAGARLGEITATPGTFSAYNSGAATGIQNAKCLLKYPCTVAADGTISGIGDLGETRTSAPAYFAGTFRCEDLTSLTTGEVTSLGARVIQGSVTAGLVRLP